MVDTLESEYCRKHDRQNDHQQERIQHGPEKTDDRPLVTDRQVSPNEIQEEMGILDELVDLLERTELRVS